MMKKFLILTILFFSFGNVVTAASFPDVSENHINYEAIEYLKEKGVVNGYPDGTFGPDNPVNRAEAMKMMTLAFSTPIDGTYEIIFPDVKSDAWYFAYVMGAREAGIINGYPDGKFRPANTVNLAESLKILLNAAHASLPEAVDVNVFEDVPNDAWFSTYSLYAKEHNIVLADDYGKIYPNQDMSRSSFAEILYRTMIITENSQAEFNLNTNWKMYEGTNFPFRMKYDNHEWQIIENEDEIVFFKPDTQYKQFSPNRVYPNSAIVRVTLDYNDLQMSKDDYFTNIKNVFSGAQYTDFQVSGLPAIEVLYPDKRTVDWYIFLEDSTVLVVYTEYGNGVISYQLPKLIKAMLSTLEYKQIDTVDYTEILQTIFSNILVEGKGMEMLNLLPDKELADTDAMGIGTGPVDYYYSQGAKYTFKYERNSDTLLDKREGLTTAF